MTTYVYVRGDWDEVTETFTPVQFPPQLPDPVDANGEDVPWPDGRGLKTIMTKTGQTASSGIAGKSTRTITVTDKHNNLVEARDEVMTVQGEEWRTIKHVLHTYDADNRIVQTRENGEIVLEQEWDDAHLIARVDRDGTRTTFQYDALDRLWRETKEGVAESGAHAEQPDVVTEYTYDAADRLISTRRIAGDLELVSSKTYDLGGRVLTTTDEAGLVTTYSYSQDEKTTTTTHPDQGTEVTTRTSDGLVSSISGTSVLPRHYQYSVTYPGNESHGSSSQAATRCGGLNGMPMPRD